MKYNFFFRLITLLVLLSAWPLLSQRLAFEFDYAQFRFDSSANYLELYYMFEENSLVKVTSDSGFLVEGSLHVQIKEINSDSILISKKWLIPHVLDSTDKENTSLVGLIGFILPSGTYDFQITAGDARRSNSESFWNETISIKPLWGDNLSVSDIQLSSKMFQDSKNTESIFYKNTLEVIPAPTGVFGVNAPVVFYYIELYSLKSTENNLPLQLKTTVFNSRNQLIYNKTRNIDRSSESRVEVGSFVVKDYPTDTYTLSLTIIDSITNYGVTSSKRFFVYNPDIMPSESEYTNISSSLGSVFGALSEEELDDIFNKSKYIASKNEESQYGKLSTEASKRDFLFSFWESRDRTPGTPRNEYFLNYFNRSEISNQRFGTLQRKGWQTDRGRVFMVYGEPSEIERYPSQVDVKPYEIWHYYDIEGGVMFVFADVTGFSEYVLVHSTMRGELSDESWHRRIQVR